MAPIIYFSTFILSTLCLCLAQSINLRELANGPVSVQPLPAVSYESPEFDLRDDTEAELLDIVLVASVDGKLHALKRSTGQRLWSITESASNTSHSSSLAPLVRTAHVDNDQDTTDEHANQETYIIEPQTGDIYVLPTPSSPLQRFPFSMAELVEMSPFSFSDGEERRVFVGRKVTSLLQVELETGIIKATLDSECPWDPFEDLQGDNIDLDELEGGTHKASLPTEVFIGRTDYHISVHTKHLGDKPSILPVQKLIFSTYGPNNQDSIIQAAYQRTPDNLYIESLPSGKIISFNGSPATNTGPIWASTVNATVVAVFDVLRQPPDKPAAPSHTYVLLQPRLGLQEFFPSLSVDAARKSLPNWESAYIGMVKESGSLFAMSPSRYPLIAFNDATEQPPSSLIIPRLGSSQEISEVDSVTLARRERERIERCTVEGIFDRTCLIGVRRLEGGDGEGADSRLKRLLDGPSKNIPSLPSPSDTDETTNETVREALPDRHMSPGAFSWLKRYLTVGELVTSCIILAFVSLWISASRFRNTSVIDGKPRIVLEDSADPSAATTIPTQLTSPVILPSIENTVAQPDVQTVQNMHSEGDGDESDVNAEGDTNPPTKRKRNRRGGRGGKKKKSQVPIEDNPVDDEDLVDRISPEQGSIIISPRMNTPPAQAPSLVVSDQVLGFGSHGTVVFKGCLQGRAVAVKRLLQDFVTLASREVTILQESDDHPNVIRYYYQENQGNFLYIALELCPASLADIIECPDKEEYHPIIASFDVKKALRQITSGLRHLHALKLVHRDIKPQNILISTPKLGPNGPGYRMLISDFGLCKKLEVDQTSFLPTAQGAMAAGTVGWRAPEILRGEVNLDVTDDQSISSSRGSSGTVSNSTGKATRLTKSVDIFALGCLFYYTLTNGGHPFGDRFEREVNILKNNKNLGGLAHFGEEGSEGCNLIAKMLDPVSYERPDTKTCLLHPFFWDSGRRLNFFQDASDRFEIMCRDPRDPNLTILETGACDVVGKDWQAHLDKMFLETLGKFRKYDGGSVQDLLRALRNKKHHYQDLPDNVKRHIGSMPDGYLAYFTRRFPDLFLHVHSVVESTPLREESMFKSYFELPE